MGDIEKLDDHRPAKFLYSMDVCRMADGRLMAVMTGSDEDWIIAAGDNIAERFRSVAADMSGLARNFEEVAMRFDEDVVNEP